ncbi:MAG: N-acetyl-alpha-D-glucosaminyl L-malate synthase BshA, partial [Bacteroidetes bacterium]|nr:N-acetyl-alpha-D-glucosaminyl L-malate synthase BshA [Bacteroidota bacterium]
ITYTLNLFYFITAVSQSLKNDTLELFPIHNEIEVIPNFVDMTRFSKKPREHFKRAIAPNGERVIVHTSNFRKVKRVDDVIEVFRLINKQIPSRLLMIGDGPERIRVERECRECDMCDQISFLGKQDAVEELLSVSDLFIMPSETESFGLAALEAMACQVPVISTNTGGLPEVNIHGKTGFTCAVGDIQSMAKYGIEILESDEQLNQFKQAALEHAMTFDINTVGPLYMTYYEQILQSVNA